jgi:hypothetical protein
MAGDPRLRGRAAHIDGLFADMETAESFDGREVVDPSVTSAVLEPQPQLSVSHDQAVITYLPLRDSELGTAKKRARWQFAQS